MSISSAASSSLGPSTPLPPSVAELPLTPTPSRESISSPPDSLRQYKAAMKQHTTAAWAAALKDLKDHADVTSRRRDPDYGFDENPFDRHHLEYLSPTKPKPVPSASALPPVEPRSLSYREREEKLRLMLLGESPTHRPASLAVDDIEMGRSRSASPSPSPSPANVVLGLPDNSPTPGSSAFMHTPFSAESGPSRRPAIRSISWLKREHSYVSEGADTPGSTFSEASFEAVSGDNYFSMYGASKPSGMAPPPAPSGAPRPILGARQSSGTSSGLGLALAGVDLNRASVISSATESTITSLSSVGTITPADVGYAHATSIRPARPSILKPRPTPYPPVVHPVTPQRRRWASGGDEDMEVLPPAEEEEEEDDEDWIHGRTVSEEMILRAGARCLRSRGITVRP